MNRLRKRFVQLWERQLKNARLPSVFYFTKTDHGTKWRCYYGHVGKVRRSRVFIDRSAVYGFVSAKELLQEAAITACAQPSSNSRFIRSRIIDRIKRPHFAYASSPAASSIPGEPGMIAAADASGSQSINLL